MTGYTPRGTTSASRIEAVQKQLRKGIQPKFDRFGRNYFSTSDDAVIVAMREAVEKCYQPDPTKRSSAQDIVNHLFKALHKAHNDK